MIMSLHLVNLLLMVQLVSKEPVGSALVSVPVVESAPIVE